MQANRLNHTGKRTKVIARAQGSDLQQEANRVANKETMTAYCKLAQRMGCDKEKGEVPVRSVRDGEPLPKQEPQLLNIPKPRWSCKSRTFRQRSAKPSDDADCN